MGTHEKALSVRDRRETVANLSLAGRTDREIADEIGESVATVRRDLRFYLDQANRDTFTGEQIRRKQIQELEELKAVWLPRAMQDEMAFDRYMKINQELTRLYGAQPKTEQATNVPQTIQINISGVDSDNDVKIIDGEFVVKEVEQEEDSYDSVPMLNEGADGDGDLE